MSVGHPAHGPHAESTARRSERPTEPSRSVSAGQGVALVDPFTALAATGGEVQTRLLEPAVSVPVYALTRVHEQPLPAQAMLLKQLRAQAERLLQDGHN